MQKYGQPGVPPTKQAIVANECPMNCGKPSAVLLARPPQGSVATWWSRCQRCLAYWETSPAGKVVALRVIAQMVVSPDCRECQEMEALAHIHVCTHK
jgi:hypothetical protein